MQAATVFVALFSLAAALPGAPGYDKNGNSDCHLTKTCSASYSTYATTYPVTETATITKTSYTPQAYTTEVTKTITLTTVVPSVYTTTKTIVTEAAVPYETYSYTTICTTSKVICTNTKTVPTTLYSTCPVTTDVPSTYTKVTEIQSMAETTVACPYTTVHTIPGYSTSICTATTTECADQTVCTPAATPFAYGYGQY